MPSLASPSPWRGALAGLAAGLVASAAMDAFQRLAATLSDSGGGDESATSRAADRVSQAATGAPVPDARKAAAGQAVHYVTGALLGLGYGVLAEYRPAATGDFGTRFALTTATLLDEGAVPAAGLGDAPWQTPASGHAYALASHLVFGTAAEATRRTLRALL
jgi:hypothetical protein